jgi:hypothetical protein
MELAQEYAIEMALEEEEVESIVLENLLNMQK